MPLNLPTELVLEIISYLQYDDVSQICLALTCRQFYIDIMPEVRKEHAGHVRDVLIPAKVLRAYQSDTADAVNWGLAFDPTAQPAKLDGDDGEVFQGTFRRLKFLSLPSSGKGMRSVRSLLVSAPALDHVELQVPSSCEHKALVHTLSLCASRPLTRLTIFEDPGGQRKSIAIALGRTPTFEDPKGFGFSKFRLPEALRRLSKDKPQALTQPPLITGLSLTYDTIFFFEICPIIIQLINTAPLDSLFISRPPIHDPMCVLSNSHWAVILSSISTRAKHVTFKHVPLEPNDLLLFLYRHPNITHLALELSTISNISFPSIHNDSPWLPKLSTLEGDASTVLSLLVARKSRTHLPLLQHLVFKKHLEFNYTRHDDKKHAFHAVYRHITRHSLKFESITVASLCNSGLIPWIVSPITDSFSLGWEAPRQFTGVKKLVFMDGGFDITDNVRADMMDWIDEHCLSIVTQVLRSEQLEKSLISLGRLMLDDGDVDADVGTDKNMNADTDIVPEIQVAQQRDAKIVERFLWHVCPNLQVIELRDLRSETMVEVIYRQPRAVCWHDTRRGIEGICSSYS
ncbi:hypothetical protein D9619_009989 [Psilocybe cf. subviscida]|uniref:F-box domain-containing protein n=1 Tax=Psilocybe cf. subviscida TaxID=2480587 RepID=A0A8H5BKX8_9AGAR|nr:hypothetical protein D9619_009989 [Psilocybe cf. subviscida]